MEIDMTAHLRSALVLFLALSLLTGVVYPAVVTGVAQGLMPGQANGSVIERKGAAIGSELIGQAFADPGRFWSRPSASGPAYNGAASTGSNLGPTNPALLDAMRDRVEALRQAHPDQTGPVPADLVTASASGLDPHISPAAARYQAQRVASARGLKLEQVLQLIDAHTEGRTLGVLGEPRVHVLRLNLALE
jgi:K+-transporting ATPase ATPase C chain